MAGERHAGDEAAGSGAVRVTVVLFGHLAGLAPAGAQGRVAVRVAAPGTVADALDAVPVPADARTFLTLDGRRVPAEAPVHDGAELRVVVPLGGG